MRGVIVLVVLGLVWDGEAAQYLNNRPYPTYSLESMPDTDFTCREKVLGGYYADRDTQCQMFHICVKVSGVGVQDFRFLCPNGTAFDQDHQICADWDDVDCDATTLYYSSDNFDLYRLGSGFESKAVKYGEEEETFALQRAETGDARINREHQAQRVNQQKEYNTASPFRRNNHQTQPRQDNNEKDIFKGSSSSNFFNNRNNGKEVDDDEDNTNINANQDVDYEQKRKTIRKQVRKHPHQNHNQDNSEAQTQRPSRPTGFLNNFAGSSVVTTPRSASTASADGQYVAPNRGRQRQRQRQNIDRQYNNADNFRQQTTYNQNSNVQQTPIFTISTPAPFKQTQHYTPTSPAPKQIPTVKETENYPSTISQQKQTFQQKQTENYPSTLAQPKQTVAQQKQTFAQKETENYPSALTKQQTNNYPTTPLANTRNTQLYDKSYDVPKVKQTENYPTTSVNQNFETKKQSTPTKQTDNYPTTFPSKTRPTSFNTQASKDFPSTFSPRTNAGYTQISQQTTQEATQNTQQYNSPTTQQQSQRNTHRNTQQSHRNSQPTTIQRNTQEYNTQTTVQQQQQNTQQSSQNTQQYNSQPTTQQQRTTKQNTQQYNSEPTTQQQRNTQQFSQNAQQYNSQATQQRTTQQKTTQYFNTQTTQNSTPRPSTFTQYTPTVPKVASTTPISRSNRFDETQYDDGSYSSKYDDYDNKSTKNYEDEFLKTAHSTNIASSRNELAKSTKNTPSTTSKPYYESPRPFSLSPSTSKITDLPKSTAALKPSTNPSKVDDQKSPKPAQKKDKNTSYDYAYYDNNPSNEPEYEIETDFKKSTTKQ